MPTPHEHYATHLGRVYSWMLGDLDAVIARNRDEWQALGFGAPQPQALAVDLGAGPGAHAIALCELGYTVIALDDCNTLVKELDSIATARGLRVKTVEASLEGFRAHVPAPADLILCMGDTLTHLQTMQSVERLLEDISAALAPGGAFIATFRDYASVELQGPQRFISVRSTPERIMTCFLDYGSDTVMVHDVLHELSNGAWQMKVSCYPKLRLAPDWIVAKLESLNLVVQRTTGMHGMVRIVATRRL